MATAVCAVLGVPAALATLGACAPAEAQSQTRPSTEVAMAAVLDDLLLAVGEESYFGPCPTLDVGAGIDPLSSEAQSSVAAITGAHHCSWIVVEGPDGTILNLERLDVLDDEAMHYVALTRGADGWRVASPAERFDLSEGQHAVTSDRARFLEDLVSS